jgi:hypothetical protein
MLRIKQRKWEKLNTRRQGIQIYGQSPESLLKCQSEEKKEASQSQGEEGGEGVYAKE